MLTFEEFASTNMSRCIRWHNPQEWTISDWAVAMAGEAGEVCNAVKKLNRVDGELRSPNGYHNNPKNRTEAIDEIGKEIADTVIYCDLLAQRLGLNLNELVAKKFNETSEKYGFPERLAV